MKGRAVCVLSLLALLSAGAVPGLAATINVGPNFAIRTIQIGVDLAQTGDVVLVEPGIYHGPENTNISFAGKAITVKGRFGAANTIIECAGTARGFQFVTGETRASVLKGFAIRNGNGNLDGQGGGGIFIKGASPKILKCLFVGNASGPPGTGINGGAIRAVTGGSPLIRNCTFAFNLAARDGGAISISTGSPVIDQCLLFRNKAGVLGNPATGSGAGIDLSGTNALVSGCTISTNKAAKEAAGLKMSGGGTTTVVNTIIFGNKSPSAVAPEVLVESAAIGGHVLNATFSDLNMSPPPPGAGNILAPPVFAAKAANNFALAPGSRGVNEGTPTPPGGLRKNDILGNPRVSGFLVDMGAFELQQ